MADFGLVGPSYQAPSIYQEDQECINWRVEIDGLKQPQQRGYAALYPTPGLTYLGTLLAGQPVRALRSVSSSTELLIAVCGAYIFEVYYNGQSSIIGQLKTSSGPVSITDNGLYAYIVDGNDRYSWLIQPVTNTATFQSYINNNVLNINSLSNGTPGIGCQIFGDNVAPGTFIVGGQNFRFFVNKVQFVDLTQMNSVPPSGVFTGSIAIVNGAPVLTVTAVQSGSIKLATTIMSIGLPVNIIVTANGTGTGGVGTYNLSAIPQASIYSIKQGGTGDLTATVQTVEPHGLVTNSYVIMSGVTPSGYNGTFKIIVFNDYEFTYEMITTPGGDATVVGSYIFTLPTSEMYASQFAILPPSDGPWLGGQIVDINDNYFIYSQPNTQQFAVSDLLSPITQPLSFGSKFSSPDNLVSLIANNGQLYLLGEKSSEVWVDAGSFPLAYQRVPGSSTQQGIIAPFSVARLGNAFAYLSANTRGVNQIVIMNGYTPERISTHAVENSILDKYTANAIAYTYQLEGHECYVITFPSLDLTWVYDNTTGMWHKWLWTDKYNKYHRHRSNCGCAFQNVFIVGDWENGNVYYLDNNTYTDNGDEIRRLRRAPHLVQDLQREYFDELQIQFQPGVGNGGFSRDRNTYIGNPYTIQLGEPLVIPINQMIVLGYPGQIRPNQINYNPQVMLRWSNDGGSTWSKEYWQELGKTGMYKHRAIWRRLGMARDRIFEMVVTDPVKAVVVSANLKLSGGDN
jgi:hypothetical protein